MMPRWKRAAGACCAALAATVAVGCGDGGDDAEPGEQDRLVEMLNESRRLEAEAVAVENRVIERCLDDRGHTVHDPWEFMTWRAGEFAVLEGPHPHNYALPDAERAAEWGFGQWIHADPVESGRWKDWEQLDQSADTRDQWDEVDDSVFEALSDEDQYSWYVDYSGRVFAEWMWGDHFDIEAPDERVPDDGGLEIEQNVSEAPRPGGCRLEMIEAMYGEPQMIETEGGSADSVESYLQWVYRPAVPLGEVNALHTVQVAVERTRDLLVADFRERVAAEEEDFLSCLADRGHGNWTFQELGGLNLFEYWGRIYYGDEDMGHDGGPVPDPPADLPSDFESLKAIEIAMAADAAECADDTGLRAASETAWDEVNREYYASVETQLYAWQDEMREAIGRGQEILGA